MSPNHPHWAMHYIPLGSVFTACGRRRIEVTHVTDLIPNVTCRWCLQSDEYLAQRMETVLEQPSPSGSITSFDSFLKEGYDSVEAELLQQLEPPQKMTLQIPQTAPHDRLRNVQRTHRLWTLG